MSVKVLTVVWESSRQSEGSLLVLLALADNADHDGICWPSQKQLAAKSRLSERQVRRILSNLVAAGEIEVLKEAAGRGKRTVYRVMPQKADILSGQTQKADTGDQERRTLEASAYSTVKPSSNRKEIKGSLFFETVKPRFCGIMKRRPSTNWMPDEIRAFDAISPVDDDELAMVERYYAGERKKEKNILRTSMLTLLRHWPTEVDRARAWCEKHPLRGSRTVKAKPDTTTIEPASDEQRAHMAAMLRKARESRFELTEGTE